jgi:hypothetical protein
VWRSVPARLAQITEAIKGKQALHLRAQLSPRSFAAHA